MPYGKRTGPSAAITENGRSVRVIRSARKTVSLEMKPDGTLTVRAPYRMTAGEIRDFLRKNEGWIQTHLERAEARRAEEAAHPAEPLTEAEIRELGERAARYIPERVAYYAEKIGVTYGRITIRNQRTRWGSCSAKGNLNFNCLLMLAPPEVIDSVVVHELCHRKEMNHSDRFYAEVYRAYPEYDRWNRWLKENGGALIRRMTG